MPSSVAALDHNVKNGAWFMKREYPLMVLIWKSRQRDRRRRESLLFGSRKGVKRAGKVHNEMEVGGKNNSPIRHK